MRTSSCTLLLLLGLAACGDIDEGPVLAVDAGDVLPPALDAGIGMAGFDTSGPLSTGAEPPDTGSDGRATEAAGVGYTSCYDGLDNDEDNVIDCADDTCAPLGMCRVGSGRACRAEPQIPLDFGGCTDADSCPALASSGAVTVFGSPAPWVAGGRFHPGGNDFDSGALFTDVVDLRAETIVLEGDFHAPTCDPGVACVETVALGLTAQAALGSRDRVEPVVALALASARNEMQVVVGATVVAQYAFDEAIPTWSLELRPTGEIFVANDGAAKNERPLAFAPIAGAHAVAYGRNRNAPPDSPTGASLSRIVVDRGLCDMPAAWVTRDPISLELAVSGAPSSFARARGVSVARVADTLYLVFERESAEGQSELVAAFETSAGPTHFREVRDATMPILAASSEPNAVALHDPELVHDGARYHLFYTVEQPDGRRRIGHATGDALDALGVTPAAVDPVLWDDILSVEMPTVARTPTGFVLVARTAHTDGATRLTTFVGTLESGLLRHRGSTLGDLTARAATATGATFDAEEIASPSLVTVGSTFFLYYSGRRGTRYGLGLYASEDFVTFRDVTASGPLLTGRAGQADALGPVDSDVMVEGDLVTLFYAGDDGASSVLVRASRLGGGAP